MSNSGKLNITGLLKKTEKSNIAMHLLLCLIQFGLKLILLLHDMNTVLLMNSGLGGIYTLLNISCVFFVIELLPKYIEHTYKHPPTHTTV